MSEDKNAGQVVGLDKKKPLFSKENEAPLGTGTAEAAQTVEDDITLPGVERPGNEAVKKELNPNTE